MTLGALSEFSCKLASVWISLSPLPIWLVVLYIALVNNSGGIVEFALAIGPVIVEIALVELSVIVNESPSAVSLIVFPLALVALSSLPNLDPKALSLFGIFVNLTVVPASFLNLLDGNLDHVWLVRHWYYWIEFLNLLPSSAG